MDQPPEEIFEINDFTVVTELERFVVCVEAVIHEWQLSGKRQKKTFAKGVLQRSKWNSRIEPVVYGGLDLKMTHWFIDEPEVEAKEAPETMNHVPALMLDLLDVTGDFCPNSVASFYGLSEYIVLSPANQNEDSIATEDMRTLFLSGITMAVSAAECDVPMLLQYGDAENLTFAGICQNRNTRTEFASVYLRYGQPRHMNLAGLLDLFKEKVACPLPTPPPVKVSVRVDYTLEERLDSQFSQQIPDFDADDDVDQLLVGPNSHLPFGASQDPLREFRLSATWPNLNEDMIVENDVYSDLDPLTAPYWTAAVAFESGLHCLMHDCMTTLVNATRYESPVDAILGIEESAVGSAALDRLTQPHAARILQPNLSLTNPAGARDSYSLPFDSPTVDRWISAIFSDDLRSTSDAAETATTAQKKAAGGGGGGGGGDRAQSPGIAVKEVTDRASPEVDAPSDDVMNKYTESLKQSKSAPSDSVTSRLAVAMCHILSSSHGLPGMCQMWREVVLSLRTYWENGELLPGFDASSPPDMASCLLHQKLMMLQCCIESKRSRYRMLDTTTNFSDTFGDDEFFDAIEDVEEVEVTEPQGRLKPLMDLKLLKKPTVPLYIPVTQDPSPMTEDLLEEHAEYLTSLGDSFDAGKARAKAQSDTLLSDMQAFKAANPGCCMEDFVRWHSPRDWIVDDTDPMTGRLSDRMSTSGNAWIDAWQSARAVPVPLQKRLFNESKEAEKILHWLGGLAVCDLIKLLLPALYSSAVRQILREAIDVQTLIGDKLETLCQKLVHCTRHGSIDAYRDLLGNVHWVESTAAQYRALRARLTLSSEGADKSAKQPRVTESDMKLFVLALMQNTNGAVPIFGAANGPIGLAVRRLLESDARLSTVGETADTAKKTVTKSRVPPAASKQYVLRWVVPRPTDYSRPTPQRMYVSIDERTEFRLCGAFSEDITLS